MYRNDYIKIIVTVSFSNDLYKIVPQKVVKYRCCPVLPSMILEFRIRICTNNSICDFTRTTFNKIMSSNYALVIINPSFIENLASKQSTVKLTACSGMLTSTGYTPHLDISHILDCLLNSLVSKISVTLARKIREVLKNHQDCHK